MLVLSRFPGEAVCIGGNVKVTVLQLNEDKVRLGIEAPPEVTVHREEIQKRIDAGEPRPARK